MKKSEIIAKYGEEAYEKILARNRAYYKAHKERESARVKKYRENHLEEVKANKKKYSKEHSEQVIARNQEIGRKDGKYYDKHLAYNQTGLQGDRNKIRIKHGRQYKPYKDIIAPDSQLHHEWIPRTADYRGVALVEADQHMHGFVDVIEILDGKITLLTEKEVADVETKSYV